MQRHLAVAHELVAVVEHDVAQAGAAAVRMEHRHGVAQLVPDAPEGPFLGEAEVPGVATLEPGEGADVLDHPRLLVVGLLDQEAVVGDMNRFLGR